MSSSGRRFRKGGNAYWLLDPLGWKAHGGAWPFVWFARKFKPGSKLNELGYRMMDRVAWRRVEKALRRSR